MYGCEYKIRVSSDAHFSHSIDLTHFSHSIDLNATTGTSKKYIVAGIQMVIQRNADSHSIST